MVKYQELKNLVKKQNVDKFIKDESIKPYGGYKLIFYPDEFVLPGGKDKKLLHIHVIGQEGEIGVYLRKFNYD